MSNVKQRVIDIVMGLPTVEPSEVVAVPAEMTVEQAREHLDLVAEIVTTGDKRDELRAALDRMSQADVDAGVYDKVILPDNHPEPSEDPTGFSGFSGKFTLDETAWTKIQDALDAPPRDLPKLKALLTEPGFFDKPKPFLKFKMWGDHGILPLDSDGDFYLAAKFLVASHVPQIVLPK